jgi:hypothetical protein
MKVPPFVFEVLQGAAVNIPRHRIFATASFEMLHEGADLGRPREAWGEEATA